jgi:hypothetical protein
VGHHQGQACKSEKSSVQASFKAANAIQRLASQFRR